MPADDPPQGLVGTQAAVLVGSAWPGIALHTPEIPLHMAPEIALVTRGVELDVLGIGYDKITDEQRAGVVAAHPRPNFQNQILEAFTNGFKDRPDTTFGTVNADVLAHLVPGFRRTDFVEVIQRLRLARMTLAVWPEGEFRKAEDTVRYRDLIAGNEVAETAPVMRPSPTPTARAAWSGRARPGSGRWSAARPPRPALPGRARAHGHMAD